MQFADVKTDIAFRKIFGMKQKGMAIADIMEITGLSREEMAGLAP